MRKIEICARLKKSPRKSLVQHPQQTGLSESSALIAAKLLHWHPVRQLSFMDPVI
jgi:hypothetical protein